MHNAGLRFDPARDLHTDPAQVSKPVRNHRNPNGLAVDDRVERTTKGHVCPDPAAGGGDVDTGVEDE